MSRKIRTEGLKHLAKVAARQISPIDKLYDAKEGYEGVFISQRKEATFGRTAIARPTSRDSCSWEGIREKGEGVGQTR